jgi:hypothetical protein
MATDQECERARVRSPRRVDQRPSASGLASHYGPRVDGHREQTKRSRVNIARLSDGIAALISREPSGDWELPQTKLGDTPI